MSFIEDFIKPAVPILNVAVSALTIYSIFDAINNRNKLTDMQLQVLTSQLGLEAPTEEELKAEFLKRYGWQKEQVLAESAAARIKRSQAHTGGGQLYTSSGTVARHNPA